MKNKNALIIIAKSPEIHTVKTRLKGAIPDNERLRLYISLLKHTVNKLKSISGIDTFIAYSPQGAGTYFSRYGVRLISLTECDLGTNMREAFGEIFARGYRKAALVGADIPGLSGSIIGKAFGLLSDHDLVFGPARDGGYYLVGMRKLIKEVFEDVPWSSDQTLGKSLLQAEKYGYSVGFTEQLSDIDTIEDVRKSDFHPM